jgi:GT2 family glycosyltransferase
MLSIVIPTYQREAVLLQSLHQLLALKPAAAEIIVVDQTQQHEPETDAGLRALEAAGALRWLRRDQPSIPAAMNAGLQAAASPLVLFLDDDILPHANLVAAHLRAQQARPGLVAGQVLQPGEAPVRLRPGQPFLFRSDQAAEIAEFMGGNFSLPRDMALALGGFDENFIGAAYRFEAEFAHRYTRRHGPIRFEPSASIHHLQASSGGTRAHGHHLRSASPAHSAGAYYFWLRTRQPGWWWRMPSRLLRSVRTRHHLRRPWWILPTLLAEWRGWRLALRLHREGPRLLAAPARLQDGT